MTWALLLLFWDVGLGVPLEIVSVPQPTQLDCTTEGKSVTLGLLDILKDAEKEGKAGAEPAAPAGTVTTSWVCVGPGGIIITDRQAEDKA